MREILFQGLSINTGEWIESMTIAKGTIKRKKDCVFLEVGGEWIGVVPETVRQFTGKTDLNARKAFEGDIFLDQNGDKWVISWSDSNSAFFAGSYGNEYQKATLLGHIEVCRIIGNIHEQKNDCHEQR